MKETASPWMAALLIGCLGCSGEETGEIEVLVYGEDFIEDGIAADEFSDGWRVEFERFDVSLRDIVVAGTALSEPDAVDLARTSSGSGHAIGSLTAPEGAHGNASFVIERIDIEGRAERDDLEKTFAWVFDEAIAYDRCETVTSVTPGERSSFQITVHADHLFYDSLVAEELELFFQALADADADDDGSIEQTELDATDIGAYDPGSEGGIDNLWQWLVALSGTLGHVDGEGHCRTRSAN